MSLQGMKIAELARRSGTSKETIHFYLREGLLRKPKKTSRNMAYYDESHVEQLKLIKRLRTESYLPLNVIKKVMKDGKLASNPNQLDLAGELFGGSRNDFTPLTKKELSEQLGLSESRIEEYEAAGLLRPKVAARGKQYGWEDVRITEILKSAEREAGPDGAALVIQRFAIIERHMEDLVRDELGHFFTRVITEGDPKRALELLRGGRETIGRYLAFARARRLHDEVEAMMPAIENVVEHQAEPLYQPLPDETRVALHENDRRRALLERFQTAPDPITTRALFEHLVMIGEARQILDIHAGLSGDIQDDQGVLAWVAEAMAESEKFDEAMAILQSLRTSRDKPDPMLEALWGSIVLIRLRRNFATLSSSTELIGYITRAFTAFDLARSTPAANLLASARVHLLLGRISIATPEFLGARPQGKSDLQTALQEVETIRRDPTLVAARHGEDPLLADVTYGALERIELNANYFLRRVA